MKEIIAMSNKEANRISVLEKLKTKEMKQKAAARILGLSVRQIRRLVKRFRKDGVAGITHQLRGVPGNRQVNTTVLDAAMVTIKKRYPDFSVTLAHEKLAHHHGFPYSRETLRCALIRADLWHSTRQSAPIIHLMRERRASEGELVQLDGSAHAWFEDRGEACTLLVYIDDATGKLLHLEFVESETTRAYFGATRRYLERHGKPLAFYNDRHGVFRVNTTKALSSRVEDSNGLTQFGRAMEELGITLLFAHSPQAKGRVERVNQTLQDRLVKELRLQGLSSIAEANRFLPAFMEEFNQQFAVLPKSPVNAHRPVGTKDDLDAILVEKHIRTLSSTLTLSFGNRIYQITTDKPTYAMRHASVTVMVDQSGSISIRYKNRTLVYRTVEKQHRTEIVDTKLVNVAIDALVPARVWARPAPTHPWKQPQLYW